MFEDILNKQLEKEFCGSCSTATSGYNPEPLTLEKMQEVMAKIPKAPAFDTIVAHPQMNLPKVGHSLGMKIIEADLTETIQTFKPRTKCKRIQKKAKKLYTKTVPSNKIYMIDTTAFQRTLWKPFEWRGL